MNQTRKAQVVGVLTLVIICAAAAYMLYKGKSGAQQAGEEKDIVVTNGTIYIAVKTTGNVEPQNRLEVKPPTAGRI
jgi:multidrug efflux pump subunit AcrA (membrane-fusion protein)